MQGRRFLWAACAAIVALFASVTIVYALYEPDGGALSPPQHGPTALAGPQVLSRTLQFQGRIDRSREIEFFSEVSGVIEQVAVAYGKDVAQGEVLARFSARELDTDIARLEGERDAAERWNAGHYPAARKLLEQAIAAARAEAEGAMAEAKATVAAYERGVREGISTAAERDAAREAAQKAAAEAQRRLQERRLELTALEDQRAQAARTARVAAAQLEARVSARSRLTLTAPFDGTVTGLAEALRTPGGKPIAQGQYLLTLTDLGESVVQLSVDARELRHFAKAGELHCVAPRARVEAPCRVQSAQRADPAKGYVVRLQVGADFGQIGDVVTVSLPVETHNARVAIPAAALRHEGDSTHVVLLRQGRPVARRVVVGFQGDRAIEIVEGLQAGESVVLR